MTTTLAALLRAVCEDPADDLLRLVLADWLDDDGQAERAEFVRVQVELSRINPGPDEHARASNLLRRYHKGAPIRMRARTPATLLAREAILLDENGEKWFRADRGMDAFCPVERNAWTFRPVRSITPFSYWLGYSRGLLGRFDGPLADWLAHGPAVVLAAPVEAVVLAGKEPYRSDGMGLWNECRRASRQDQNACPTNHCLPAEVFFVLRGLGLHERVSGEFLCYPSPEQAREAASLVLVNHARQQADLPPLPREES